VSDAKLLKPAFHSRNGCEATAGLSNALQHQFQKPKKGPGGDPFEIAAFSLVALNEREISPA